MGFFGLSKPKNKEKDNMVLLATAHGNVEMSVLQSILEGEGIPFMASDRGSGGVVRIIAGYSMYGTDIYVSKDSANSQLYQVKIGELFMLEFTKNGDVITIEADQDKYSASGEDYLGSFKAGEWATVRVECYPATEDDDFDTPQLKIWIDEVLVDISENYIGKGKTEPNYASYAQVELYSLMSASATVYFDNTFTSKEEKVFDVFDEEISDSRG